MPVPERIPNTRCRKCDHACKCDTAGLPRIEPIQARNALQAESELLQRFAQTLESNAAARLPQKQAAQLKPTRIVQ